MKFVICSTSEDFPNGEWLCEKPKWDISGLKEWNAEINSDGRVIDKKKYWEIYVEIKGLDDLKKLTKKFGCVIVNDNKLEIYDGYRE